MSRLALQDPSTRETSVYVVASSTTLPDSMEDKSMESDEISSSTTESSQSESSIEDTPPSYETSRRHGAQEGLTMSHTSSTSHMTTSSQPTNPVDVMSSSHPKPPYGSKATDQALDKASAMLSRKLEAEQVSSCYSGEEGRRSSASLISSVLLPSGDPKQLQNLESMNLSNYVKLMNLDVPGGLALNLQGEPNSISGLRTSVHQVQPNHSMAGGTQSGGHMIPGAGHMMNPMMGGRGAMKPAIGDYNSPPRASLSMAQASALLIPSPNQGGILTIQDSRSTAIPGIVDMIPPSFSPGLPGGLNSASTAASGASLNFFPPQTPASSSVSPRQQSGPQTSSLHGRRLGKRSHDLLVSERNSVNSPNQDFSANMIRDITFPPDSGCGSDRQGKGVDIKPSPSYNFSGVGLEGNVPTTSQHLKWQAHMVNTWTDLCDGALQDIPQVGFQVDTDKGFNYSIWDDAFVCQKKNHFQVTVTATFPAIPKFVKMKSGSLKPVTRFTIHLHGVKFEQVNSEIKLEQSKSDRSKTKFEPEVIEIPSENGESMKRTLCRLHFSETTHNNMRKRGKPNPEQKYFSLVVALHANTADLEDSFPVVAHVSERIIVRASNPGNFDNDGDVSWFKSSNSEYIYHQGRVGINTDRPEEALSVHGNIQVTGQILQASDVRIKQNIKKVQLQRNQHLDRISRLQLYEYQLAQSASHDKTSRVTPNHTHRAYTERTRISHGSDDTSSFSPADVYDSGYHANGALDECRVISRVPCEDMKVQEIEGKCVSSANEDCQGREKTPQGSSGVCNGGNRRIVGLLAQEVREVLPSAVIETEQEVQLADGSEVQRLLVVDKDQVLMEVIGAVKELRTAMESHQEELLSSEPVNKKSLTRAEDTSMSLNMAIHKDASLIHHGVHLTLHIRTTVLHCFILVISFLIFSFILHIIAY